MPAGSSGAVHATAASGSAAVGPSGPTADAGGADTVTAAAAAADAADAAADAPYDPGTVLATLAEGATADQLREALAETPALAGTSVAGLVGDGGVVKLALPPDVTVDEAIGLLAQVAPVAAAQPNYRYHIQGASSPGTVRAAAAEGSSLVTAAISTVQAAGANDPYYVSGRQWSLPSVNAPEAWSLVDASAATPATVAIIDEGFRVGHEDLALHVVDTYNVTTGSSTIAADSTTHGTHVAGIVGAVTNNGKGVASIGGNAVGLMLVRVADSEGVITTDAVVDAYSYIVRNAAAHNVRVVNMSLGASSPRPVNRSSDPALYDAIARARNAGIVSVAAACNEDYEEDAYPPFYAYPGDFDNVVSVINLAQSSSAANADGVEREESSNYNTRFQTESSKAKNISAPGSDIYSTYGTSATSYVKETGTSMASPLVAGVLGLMFTVNPNLTAAQAETLLYQSAKDLTAWPASTGWDRYTGYGEVDAAAALAAAGAAVTEPLQISIATCAVEVADATYNGSPLEPAVTVTDGQVVLTRGIDYSVEYRNNTNAGVGTVTVKGMGAYTGINVGTFTIAQVPLTSVTLKAETATYNGKQHKPVLRSVNATSGAVSAANYSVAYWRGSSATANFKKAGVITVKVTGKENCTGAITKTFKIKPKGTKVAHVTPLSRALAVTWKAQATQTTGYQLRIATNSAFTRNAKNVTVGNARATAKTVKSLKAKRKYYVKVRTYKKSNGTRIYSTWSNPVVAKTA